MKLLAAYLRDLREQTAAARAAGEALGFEHALEHRYLLLNGGPRAGKTAFLHHIAFLLACGIEDTRIDSVPFPVLIRPFDLPCEDDSPQRLIDLLNARNRERGWALPDDYFSRQLRHGLAVLLLDDVDRAPGAARLLENSVREFRHARFVAAARSGFSLPHPFVILDLPVPAR